MSSRAAALTVIGGLIVTGLVWWLLDVEYACLAALATVTAASAAPSVVGTARLPTRTSVSAQEVRRWRESHPGATISEAIAALEAH